MSDPIPSVLGGCDLLQLVCVRSLDRLAIERPFLQSKSRPTKKSKTIQFTVFFRRKLSLFPLFSSGFVTPGIERSTPTAKMADERLDLLALDELLDAALIEFEVGLDGERDSFRRNALRRPGVMSNHSN